MRYARVKVTVAGLPDSCTQFGHCMATPKIAIHRNESRGAKLSKVLVETDRSTSRLVMQTLMKLSPARPGLQELPAYLLEPSIPSGDRWPVSWAVSSHTAVSNACTRLHALVRLLGGTSSKYHQHNNRKHLFRYSEGAEAGSQDTNNCRLPNGRLGILGALCYEGSRHTDSHTEPC